MTDRPPYQSLTLIDRNAQDIFEAALLRADTELPDWGQHEGDPILAFLKGGALQVDELGFFANRIAPAVVEAAVANLHQVERDMGAAPTVTVQFNVAVDGPIPAGTELTLELGGDLFVTFTTDEALAAVAPSSTVTTTATENTSAANGTAAGSILRVHSAGSTIIDSAETSTAVAGGRDAETQDTWWTRAIRKVERSHQTLVKADQFEAFALETAGVVRAHGLDEFDPGSGNDPGEDPGDITVAVYGDGAPLTTEAKAAVELAMQEAAASYIVVHIIDPTISAVDVTVTVVRKAAYADQAVEDACVAALEAHLATVDWDWGDTVYRNDLIALLENVAGVDRVLAGHPTTPAADVILAGDAPLAAPGVITVTVEAP